MAQRSNVTVSLPTELLREAKHIAVDQGLSLSGFLASLVEERVEATRRYRAARDRQLRLMAKGLPVGIPERTTWSREDLHDR